MREIHMVDLKSQYLKIKDELHLLFEEILESSAFINGPQVEQFANALSDYLNIDYVIPCGNGTDALQLAFMAAELSPGDEVITTPFTFVSTVEVLALLGLKPVFVDICPNSFNIDTKKIEEKITSRTKAIIPVHLFGRPAEMEDIMNLSNTYNLIVIEDAAQSLGAYYTFSTGESLKTGTIGHIGTTSFFPSKNLGCYGDGGAVMTNNAEYAEKIKSIANHGSEKKYVYNRVGINSRLDTLQAAVLLTKLPHLDHYNQGRIKAAGLYKDLIGEIPGIICPTIPENGTHIFHQYTILIEEGRDEVKNTLAEKGIPTAVYYPLPLHLQKAYKKFGYKAGDFPVAEIFSKKVLSLPMHSELRAEDQEYIAESLIRSIEKNRGVAPDIK